MSIKIKQYSSYASEKRLYDRIVRQCPFGNKWKDIEFTLGNQYDYILCYGSVPRNVDYKKIIFYNIEQSNHRKKLDDKVKNIKEEFFWYNNHLKHKIPPAWYHGETYTRLSKEVKKNKILSAVISGNNVIIGHRLRIEVLKQLNELDYLDHYGRRPMGFMRKNKNYKGALEKKSDGLLPYKYTFNCENEFVSDIVSEKLYDGILCECLTFYDGCTNANEFVNEEAFIKVNVREPYETKEIIEKSIKDNEWEKRLPIIKQEKERLLNEYNFCNTIYKIVHGEQIKGFKD